MDPCKNHDWFAPFECPYCETDEARSLLARLMDQLKPCGACGGFGKDEKWDTQCRRCYGFGWILFKPRQRFKDLIEEIKVELEKGEK